MFHLPGKTPRQGTEWGLTLMSNCRLAYEGFHVLLAQCGTDKAGAYLTVRSAVGNTGGEWSVLRGAHVEAQMSVGSFTDDSWTGMFQ